MQFHIYKTIFTQNIRVQNYQSRLRVLLTKIASKKAFISSFFAEKRRNPSSLTSLTIEKRRTMVMKQKGNFYRKRNASKSKFTGLVQTGCHIDLAPLGIKTWSTGSVWPGQNPTWGTSLVTLSPGKKLVATLATCCTWRDQTMQVESWATHG